MEFYAVVLKTEQSQRLDDAKHSCRDVGSHPADGTKINKMNFLKSQYHKFASGEIIFVVCVNNGISERRNVTCCVWWA